MNKNTELKKETISLLNLILEESNFNDFNYKKWKRNNVTYRGIKDFSKKNNENYGSFGEGLYTAHLSNKKLAKEYGKVYYVVNAIPKNPKVVIEYSVQSVFSNNTYQCLDIAQLINVGNIVEFEIGYVGNRINIIHIKKLFVGYCKKLNIHYIMSKVGNES